VTERLNSYKPPLGLVRQRRKPGCLTCSDDRPQAKDAEAHRPVDPQFLADLNEIIERDRELLDRLAET